MKKALCLSTGVALVALPVVALLPGCGGGSNGLPFPTSTPTAIPTTTATSATAVPTTTGTAPTATPTGSPTATPTTRPTSLPTATATTRPTSTPTPRPTATSGPNINLTFEAVAGSTTNAPLTAFQSSALGGYSYAPSQLHSYADVTAGSREYQLVTPGQVLNYRVGQTIDISGTLRGVTFTYQNGGKTYEWINYNVPGAGIVKVVAKDSTSITVEFTNMIMSPATNDDPAKGRFRLKGTIRWGTNFA